MITRGTTSTCTSPTRPSRRQRQTAWCRSAPAASTGTAFLDDPDFIVLADTEGNRFCIVNLGHEHHPPGQDS